MKRLSGLCCHEMRDCNVLSPYKLCAISQGPGSLPAGSSPSAGGRDVRDAGGVDWLFWTFMAAILAIGRRVCSVLVQS